MVVFCIYGDSSNLFPVAFPEFFSDYHFEENSRYQKQCHCCFSLCVFICAGNTSEGNFYRLMKYSVVFRRYNRPKIVIEAMVMGYNGDCSDMLCSVGIQ